MKFSRVLQATQAERSRRQRKARSFWTATKTPGIASLQKQEPTADQLTSQPETQTETSFWGRLIRSVIGR